MVPLKLDKNSNRTSYPTSNNETR